MARKPSPDNPTCPHCGAAHVVRNGSKDGRPRWVCRQCRRSFGPTYGTPMYRLRTPPAEVGRTLLIVMRRGSLSAAEEISGHKYETIGRWLRAAAQHAQAITEVLVRDLHLTEVEVDAFWSFVKKAPRPWRANRPVGRGGPSVGMSDPGPPHPLRGGLVFWPLGGRSGSPGGSADPSANGGKWRSSLDQRWATCLSLGGRAGLSGPSADREAGTPTPDSYPWRGAHSGHQTTAAGADCARGSPYRDGGAAVVPICGLCGAVERGLAGSSECVDPEDPRVCQKTRDVGCVDSVVLV